MHLMYGIERNAFLLYGIERYAFSVYDRPTRVSKKDVKFSLLGNKQLIGIIGNC